MPRIEEIIENKYLLLIGQIVVLFLSIGFIIHYYLHYIYPDKRAKEVFIQTTCTIVEKQLNKLEYKPNKFLYRADFLIQYAVNNTSFTRWVSGNGLSIVFTEDLAPKEDVLSRYTIGESYTCWYDPDNPSIAILVMRHYWFSLPLIFSSIISIIIFYFFLTNLLDIISDHLVKKRVRK